ncbi:anti-sigma factor family protein [Burkholderia guangdongensis]|uniref:anti-sigma factor family protein n=1 Tax=Burkholderia guangdongensis TaxID=1792500 RepID=UPI0015C9A490|nr:anti-sigma factor [Burkholderia guangdongensis]
MSDDPHKPSNEPDADAAAQLLSALLDDELSAPARRELLARVQTHPDDAARLAHYRAQRAALHALFPLPDAAPALFVQRRASWRRSAAFGVGGLAAGLLLGIALYAGLGAFTRQPDFAARADVAYSVYAPERRHPVELDAAEPARLTAWLSERIGRPVRAPSLDEYGYALIGGRLLPGRSGPAAQLMYQRAGGERVTLYVSAFAGGTAAPRVLRAAGRSTFYWAVHGTGYALSGSDAEARLAEIATDVCGELGGPVGAWSG